MEMDEVKNIVWSLKDISHCIMLCSYRAQQSTSLRSQGLRRFKYPFLLPPFNASFKDKIVMKPTL